MRKVISFVLISGLLNFLGTLIWIFFDELFDKLFELGYEDSVWESFVIGLTEGRVAFSSLYKSVSFKVTLRSLFIFDFPIFGVLFG